MKNLLTDDPETLNMLLAQAGLAMIIGASVFLFLAASVQIVMRNYDRLRLWLKDLVKESESNE